MLNYQSERMEKLETHIDILKEQIFTRQEFEMYLKHRKDQ